MSAPDTTALVVAVERVGPLASLEDADRALAMLAAAKAWIKDREAELKDALFQFVSAQGGRVTIGEVEFRIGFETDNRCRDVRAAAQALLEASGGDWDVFAACLSANAIKPGEARHVLQEKWGDHFDSVKKDKLKTGEAKAPGVVATSTRFIKRRNTSTPAGAGRVIE
jgi:hypothetical protein